MSCAFGIIAVPSGGRAVSGVGVIGGMVHLLIGAILKILEIVKIFESGLFGVAHAGGKAEARKMEGKNRRIYGSLDAFRGNRVLRMVKSRAVPGIM
jgi:hypothetical protein